MQQRNIAPKSEGRFADGLGEYASMYGGLQWDYARPAKLASTTVQELDTSLPTPPPKDIQSTTSRFANASYDLAAHVPQYRRHAEGLQLADEVPPRTSSLGYSADAIVDARFPRPPMGHSVSSPSNIQSPYLTGNQNIQENPYCSSPTSTLVPQTPSHSDVPQPLKFKRATTMPVTPPLSNSGSSENGIRDSMKAHNLNGQPAPLRLPMSPASVPQATLSRMGTVSSTNSSSASFKEMRSPSISPFSRPGFSVAAFTTGTYENELPDMTSDQAKTEIARRVEKTDIMSSRKSSTGSSKKIGFSLKRSNTSGTTNDGPSIETLNQILEDVAQEGSLSLVKAVVSMGADPAARTKKTKHEALSKATAAGHARIVDFLLRNGAKYGDIRLKVKYTPTDYALLSAAYKGHAELTSCLIASHGANPMTEQWPREIEDTQHYWAQTQVRLPKSSVLDAISRWSNVEDGMGVMKFIIGSSRFDPAALVSGLFDSKSELQSADYQYRPWQTTYEISALACFAGAGWADTVEEMLALKGAPEQYEKEDDVQYHQEKKTRFVSPISAITRETWQKRPEDALRILHLLADRGFDLSLTQRTPTDMGLRTALGRAISADAAQAVELILQHKPSLVREEIAFRRNKRETKSLPFVVALSLDRLEVARILLRSGAHPRDPAIEDMNVLQFAASESGETSTSMLLDMLPMAPELTYDALDIAIKRNNTNNVRAILDFISAAASRGEIAALPPAYDSILLCTNTDKDVETKFRYVELIDMVYQWDAGHALYRPQLPSILNAIRKDNYAGVEKLMQLGIVNGKSLVLNTKARPIGEAGEWTILECCEMTKRSSDWLALLRYHGAPLY
ncbi:uncharacterized protein EKO05_0007593 [Ascochyta rabiei]|uniref:Uncharacterized protein n=1 Tax=Didymella rabiei TaxID=5454 RepID=A0A163LZN9_DIDRA|nr:uncharacterized protein EKO05_0007593 [Ascochyta rabiei]KZM28267.1 hypothetical protein ST47_g598 [Ascochyta rabiei]UPX17227.1 hypothetical protein EKO05_0007593 [Ascochyta rabiei]